MNDKNYLAMEDLIEGGIYELRSRNLLYGVWNKKTQGFIGIRQKFESRYLFTEFHYDSGPPYGTAFPIKLVKPLPAAKFGPYITLVEGYSVCANCKAPTIWADDPDNHYSQHAVSTDCVKPERIHVQNKPLFDILEEVENEFN